FPDTKELVETIGLSFISAPLLISMVSRITQAELTNGEYVRKLDVRAFQNRIKSDEFRNKISELIGNNEDSLISIAFKKAVDILKDEQSSIMPAVLVKDLIKKNPEVFLFLVYWLYKNPKVEIGNKQRTAILAKFTVLTWFGLDNSKYVKEIWKSSTEEDFWIAKFSKEQSERFISVLVPPQLLDIYFSNPFVIKEAKHALIQSKKEGELFVEEAGEIIKLFKKIFTDDIDEQRVNSIWWEFFRRLFWGRSLIVFAQREYINNQFKDFNQIEDLQDTNVPWDWDHIYPDSWVYNQKDVNSSIRHWNNCIGNFRALSLGENRSENAHLSPKVRLEKIEVQNKSFVKSSDFEFWSKIDNRIYTVEKVEFHTKAVVLRTLNIYREWWDKLMIDRILYGLANIYCVKFLIEIRQSNILTAQPF
ncbi:MAG: hypothetical protein Q8K26_02865, partial [Candidatus Gracilibacteria bacterium]|nr:hypothetical protein [Candidatus Gracilibacteria bacterium]